MKILIQLFFKLICIIIPFFISGLMMGLNIFQSLLCASILASVAILIKFFLEKFKKSK